MPTFGAMDALNLLKKQHQEVEKLFKAAKKAEGNEKESLFLEIADQLAIHATIEEKIFYPAVLSEKTEDELQEALQEHLQVKRLLADMLDMDPEDERFAAKMTVLEEEVQHHVEEEEKEMFKDVKSYFPKEALEALGAEMEKMVKDLKETEPRDEIPAQTREVPPLIQ